VIDSANPILNQAPKSFNAIGVNASANVQAGAQYIILRTLQASGVGHVRGAHQRIEFFAG
jgi:hypothetical protein